MNADTPTQDELRKRPSKIAALVAEVCGWSCVSDKHLTGLRPGISIEDYTGAQVLRGEVPLDSLPLFTTSLDACRIFEDVMSPTEFVNYIRVLEGVVFARLSYDAQVMTGARIEAHKANPIDRCIARLIVAARIK